MVELNMLKKGFEAEISLNQTPSIEGLAEKPLKANDIQNRKVDINVLKARAQKIQDKENRKNISIFVFFLILVGTLGIYLSI
tara:strand:- start:716 stop:961 length:246 start_codon:yes stop_codon:yes gene_type:complete